MDRGQCPEIKAQPEGLEESSPSTDVEVSAQLSDEDWSLNRETVNYTSDSITDVSALKVGQLTSGCVFQSGALYILPEFQTFFLL